MSTPNGPVSIDPVAAVRRAPVRIERIPDRVYQPPPGDELPDPPPVTIPGSVQLSPDLSELPPELLGPSGMLNLGSAVAVLWQLLHSLEIRTITGRVLLESAPGGIGDSVWLPGQSAELVMTWDEPAPVVPTGLLVSMEASIVNAAKVAARLVPGTLTLTGCRVLVENVSSDEVVVTDRQPVLVRGQALYLHTPPLTSQETP